MRVLSNIAEVYHKISQAQNYVSVMSLGKQAGGRRVGFLSTSDLVTLPMAGSPTTQLVLLNYTVNITGKITGKLFPKLIIDVGLRF